MDMVDHRPPLEGGRTGRRWRRPVAVALAATSLIVFLAGVYFTMRSGNGFHDSVHLLRGWLSRSQRWTKIVLCLICTVLVLWPDAVRPNRQAPPLLKLAAVLALLGYFNFGAPTNDGRWLHYHEMFHYELGSKYFPELGYDGLYVSSLNAQDSNFWPWPRHVRDLRTNEVVETAAISSEIAASAQRFSPERLAQFRSDHLLYIPTVVKHPVRKDHGYNPTPTWTFVARLFDAWLPSTRWTLVYLSLIDQALLAVMWVVLFLTYGSRAGCLAMTVFGLSDLAGFPWTGGALLRFDWLLAVVIGICMLKRERHLLAGVFLGYAAMVRVFPVLFLVGPAVVGLRALARKEDLRWLRRFAAGCTLAVALSLAAGSLTGRGVSAWGEFLANLRKHQSTWLTNNVGLGNVILYVPETFKLQLVDRSLPDPWAPWQHRMTELARERRPALVLASLVTLALIVAAAWRSPLDEATVLGLAAAFSLLLLTCYYWAMLLLVPLRGGKRAAAALLLLNAGLFAIGVRSTALEVIYGTASWALAVLMVLWLLPDAIRIFRRTPPVVSA